MLLSPVAMVLFGIGLVARCLDPVGLAATMGSLGAICAASLIFGTPIAWGIAGAAMGESASTATSGHRAQAD
jgi:hypothetical protein